MKKLLSVIILSLPALLFAQQYSRAKITTDSQGLQQLGELGVAVDHGTSKQNTFFISDFSDSELTIIKNAGFQVEILIEDVKAFYKNRNKTQQGDVKNTTCSSTATANGYSDPTVPSNFNLGTMGGFYTYDEFIAEIDAMATLYPSLITVKAPINTFQTSEGRPIYFLRLSDNATVDEAEPEVLYTSIHHAREPNSLSATLFYMWYLLENYATSEEIQYLVNNTELYFVPMVNPDGYIYNVTTEPGGGGLWRKNRRDIGDGNFGVDLNRNYSYGWGTTGISFDTSSDVYPGTGAFSEPETQAIKWLCENRDFQFAFNAHTYSDLLLFPIGTTTTEFAEDHDYFDAYSRHMVQHNGYVNQKSSALYPASGDSDDYMYIEDLAIKPEIYAITPEIGSDNDGFWPASNDITGLCQEMIFPNLILAHLTHRYLEVKDTDASSVLTETGNFNHSAYRLGQENGAVTVSIEPLVGIQSVGSSVNHDLTIMQLAAGSISYTLNVGIQYGDPISYVLNTVYSGWTHRDTIYKTFGSPTSQFLDEATNTANWTGDWSTTTTEFVSPTKSFTESPTGDYSNDITRTYTFNNTIDLTNATSAGVKFFAKWEIEPDYDYCQFQVSTDGGASWQGQCGLYTNLGTSAGGSVQPNDQPIYDGTQAAWALEEINLSDYLGEAIRFRFVFESDGGVRQDGFYFDDFEVLYNLDESGINESNKTNLEAKILPNPATSTATVSLNEPISSGTVYVLDMTGKLVSQHQISAVTNKISFPVAQLSEGLYTVIVVNETQQSLPLKMVVTR